MGWLVLGVGCAVAILLLLALALPDGGPDDPFRDHTDTWREE